VFLSKLLFRARSRDLWKTVALAFAILLAEATALAQTDEIQVYDAEINDPGQFSLQLHNNYTPIGRQSPNFPGGIVPNHTLNGVPEWAYGIVDWLELGAYAPVYSWTGNGRVLIDGAKLRAEFVVPHAAERSFFYGVNFELGHELPIDGGLDESAYPPIATVSLHCRK